MVPDKWPLLVFCMTYSIQYMSTRNPDLIDDYDSRVVSQRFPELLGKQIVVFARITVKERLCAMHTSQN